MRTLSWASLREVGKEREWIANISFHGRHDPSPDWIWAFARVTNSKLGDGSLEGGKLAGIVPYVVVIARRGFDDSRGFWVKLVKADREKRAAHLL